MKRHDYLSLYKNVLIQEAKKFVTKTAVNTFKGIPGPYGYTLKGLQVPSDFPPFACCLTMDCREIC